MESELVGGFFTEHSSVPFVFFFLSEYSSIVLFSALTAILFLGGYNVPHFNIDILIKSELLDLKYLYAIILPYLNIAYDYFKLYYYYVTSIFIFTIKNIFFLNSFLPIDFYDSFIKILDLNAYLNSIALQSMVQSDQSEETLSFFNMFIYSIEYINNNLLSISSIVLGLKSCLFCFFFVWFRATLPRLRYDQLINFCWLHLLPLIIAFIVFLPCLLLTFKFIIYGANFGY